MVYLYRYTKATDRRDLFSLQEFSLSRFVMFAFGIYNSKRPGSGFPFLFRTISLSARALSFSFCAIAVLPCRILVRHTAVIAHSPCPLVEMANSARSLR